MTTSYRDLIVWQKGMALVTNIYRVTENFPPREMYGLSNQLRRAAVAVPSDIAEGRGRISKKEFLQMLSKARGSCFEVQTQLEIAYNLHLIDEDAWGQPANLAAEVGRLLNGLIASIQADVSQVRDGRISDGGPGETVDLDT